MRLMANDAKLLLGFAKMGVIPESGGTWYLPRLLGWAKAVKLPCWAILSAAAALDYGLINKAT